MHLRYLVLIFTITASSLAKAAGLDISFYGPSPAFPPGKQLSIVAGLNPGIPVVFDLSKPDRVILRPAMKGETATAEQPLFKFEWLENKSARFYKLTSPTLLAELSAANTKDTQTPEGKNFEQEVLQKYLQQGEALRVCLPPSKPFRESLLLFIVVASNGKLDNAVVQPEGSVAECILERAKETTFSFSPSGQPFTVKADINVTE